MRPILLLVFLFSFTAAGFAQQSDFIILKKRNNRTLKTYGEGSFLSASTHNGFNVNGYIVAIRNDSIYIRQQETRLVGTEFGSTLDTLRYIVGIDYRELKRFNYTQDNEWGRKRGFAVITAPRLMMIGGVGFVVLELINSLYRGESLTENNKLPSLAIGAGIAAAGYVWQRMQDQGNKVGGKYKLVYIKAGAILHH